MIKKIQFCEMCRLEVPDIKDLHFVEENSDRGFCSDECILNFYKPFMKFFEAEEIELRSEISDEEELYLDLTSGQRFINLTLKSPDEIWECESEMGQKFYTHIKKINYNGDDVFNILICSHVEAEASFIYYKTATKSPLVLSHYQRSRRVDIKENIPNDNDLEARNMNIAAEILDEVESKKSQILATMLENRSASDIPIENFPDYDSYLEEAMSSADEIYENEDNEGDLINTFIKSFRLGDISFFYITLALQYETNNEEIVLIPILGFPSIDEELYPKYAMGKRINEVLKN